MKKIYLAAMLLGTCIPWLFFGKFFSENGLTPLVFVQSLFVTLPASGFTVDLLLSILIFGIWSYCDAQRHGVRKWWYVIPATCAVGLSLSLPLYLYLRHDKAYA